MKTILKVLRMEFMPSCMDGGLLVLRLWLGLSLLCLHGWGKLTGFSSMADSFPDPLGVGSHISLGLAVFAEAFCSFFLAVGLFTRLAALVLCIQMFVAFSQVHHLALKGAGSGEMAFVYLAGFVVLFVAGGGRFALDAIGCKKATTE
jgi:putative oxidoreductase